MAENPPAYEHVTGQPGPGNSVARGPFNVLFSSPCQGEAEFAREILDSILPICVGAVDAQTKHALQICQEVETENAEFRRKIAVLQKTIADQQAMILRIAPEVIRLREVEMKLRAEQERQRSSTEEREERQ